MHSSFIFKFKSFTFQVVAVVVVVVARGHRFMQVNTPEIDYRLKLKYKKKEEAN